MTINELEKIQSLRKLLDKLVSDAEHEVITNDVLKCKMDGISNGTWVMLGIDYGQMFRAYPLDADTQSDKIGVCGQLFGYCLHYFALHGHSPFFGSTRNANISPMISRSGWR